MMNPHFQVLIMNDYYLISLSEDYGSIKKLIKSPNERLSDFTLDDEKIDAIFPFIHSLSVVIIDIYLIVFIDDIGQIDEMSMCI